MTDIRAGGDQSSCHLHHTEVETLVSEAKPLSGRTGSSQSSYHPTVLEKGDGGGGPDLGQRLDAVWIHHLHLVLQSLEGYLL